VTDFRQLPDLARRDLGSSVVYANDESFAARENLITPAPSVFDPALFGPKGKVYDGWETRRRRGPGSPEGCWDEAIVRLGAPGIVRGVVVDTSWFTGNFPPEAAVDGIHVDSHPDPEELLAADGWVPLLARAPIKGDTENAFAVPAGKLVTHVRLRIFPDGGVARMRVHGEALPDPTMLDALGCVDLAALENGGRVTGCSNLFYSSPNNLLLPGPARSMGEGWETSRRRDDGNDWVEVTLAAQSTVAVAELDTSWFLHNAPAWGTIRGRDGDGGWHTLLPRTRMQPETRHRFPLPARPVTAVRVDIFPDGGMARLRLHGAPTPAGREQLDRRRMAALAGPLSQNDVGDGRG
jgi:allantoicase